MCSFNDLGEHPEKESDEVWIITIDSRLLKNFQFDSKRAGTPDEEGFVPVFVKTSEFAADESPSQPRLVSP